MSNTVTSLADDLNNSYPVFEPNQLLTNTHLNQLRTYLDVQDRLSRVKLVGMGIVCGLEVSYKNKTISISGGTGITSQGFLVEIPGGSYDRCVKANYIDPENYDPFMDDSPGSIAQIEMHELIPKLVAVPASVEVVDFTDPDQANFLKDKVVVLFAEYENVDLESCLGQNCDDKGVSRKFTVRKLLLNCSDVDAIIRAGYKIEYDHADEDDLTLRGSLNLRYNQDYAAIRPVTLIGQNVPYSKYSEAYEKLIKASLIEARFEAVFSKSQIKPIYDLTEKITNAARRFGPLLNGLDLKGTVKILDETFKKYYDECKTAHTIQYFYDFIKDLVLAYNEFFDGAFDLTAECCPDKLAFNRHLVLGKVTPGLGCPEVEDACEPAVYRTHFIQSPIYNLHKDKLAEVRNNYKRLLLMIESFQSKFDDKTVLKVTPSDEKQHALQYRSIPFYYSPKKLYKYWNYNLSKKCRPEWNLGYGLGGYLLNYDDKDDKDESKVYPPAFCSDQHNFYRVEGLLEKPYDEIEKELEILKRKFQLEFDVLALKLQKGSPPFSAKSNCGVADLKEDYLQLRNEIIAETKKYTWLISKFFYFITNAREIVGGIMGGGNDLAAQKVQHSKSKLGADGAEEAPSNDDAVNDDGTGLATQDPLATGVNFLKDLLQSIDEVDELVAAMPICIEDFNMAEFKVAYKDLQELSFNIAVAFENAIRLFYVGNSMVGVLIAPMIQNFIERFFLVNFGFIGSIYDLNDILRSNWDVKMKSILFSYHQRLDALDNKKLFSNFAKNNPGLKHMAGVPEGGTFIMVYTSDKQPQVVADFALHGKPCCKEPFPMCNTNAAKYPPVAKNVYYFINSNSEQGVPVYIDVLEFALDLNEPTEVLDIKPFPELSPKQKRTKKGLVSRVDSTVLGRAVVQYQTTNLFDTGIDKFEFTIINKRGETDTACVFVAKINFAFNLFLTVAKAADNFIDAALEKRKKFLENEVEVVVTLDDQGALDYASGGSRSLELAKMYESEIPGDSNRATMYIDRAYENTEKVNALTDLDVDSTPAEVTEYEKQVIKEHGGLMKDLKKDIQAVELSIGEVPEKTIDIVKHRVDNQEKYAELDALVTLYEDQNDKLLKVIAKQDLAKDADSELYKFVDKDVREYNAVVSKHTARTKAGFEVIAEKEEVNLTRKGLFDSLR
jgi:hypothetical protein